MIFAGLRTEGTTIVKAKKSRNHTELMCKHLKLPIRIKKNKTHDEIKIQKAKKINLIDYNIPSDISSAAFFIVLTALMKNSKITIKNLNPLKRPISAVADNIEVRNAKSIYIKTNKHIKFNLLFDKNRSLQKKIKIEQLRNETN